MKCPFTSKCHGSLSQQLQEARDAHRRTIADAKETVGRLESEKSVLEYQLRQAQQVDLSDLSEPARRRRSGYRLTRQADPETCKNCDHMMKVENYRKSVYTQSICVEHQHRVEARRGTCPGFKAVAKMGAA